MYIKTLKIRLLPTEEQELLMFKHVGACRWIWNHFLALSVKRYENGLPRLNAFGMTNLLTPLRQDLETSWLNETSRFTASKVLNDLDLAYKSFFKNKRGFPKFKSRKKSKISFPIRPSLCFSDDIVTIERLKKVKYQTNYSLPQGRSTKFYNPRISYINNKWILTVGVEFENQEQTLTDKVIGIDLGVKDLAVVSHNGEKIVFNNINKSKRVRNLNKRLKHIQRSISKKYKTNKSYNKTNNITKLEALAKEIQYHISCIRRNYIHKITHKLTSLLLPKRVIMEDLNISGMMKNRHLARAIQEQCFYEFIKQIKYKCKWNGIEFIQVDRFYPSSKMCSMCGNIKKDLKLSERTYICPVCNLIIDRDFNAAKNLGKYVNQ